MTWLIASDLHLSDRPKDNYRFGLFTWMANLQKKHHVTATLILGDITDIKDKHASSLVNRVVDELIGLRPPIYVLRGNHDCINPNNPFFRFLNCIEGVEFIVNPTFIPELGMAAIPHQRTQDGFDAAIGSMPVNAKFVVTHQTYNGAKAETGSRLSGLVWPQGHFNRTPVVWAGDVHRPQVVNCGAPVTYVGAPYHIRFGDDYTPRCLLVNGIKEQNLYFPAPRKWSLTIKSAEDIENNDDLQQGDHIKLNLQLSREELVEWKDHKRAVLAACRNRGLEIYGVDLKVPARRRVMARLGNSASKTYEDIVAAYCVRENTPTNVKRVGLTLLKETSYEEAGSPD